MSGNSIGRLFTVTTFGESHGPALGCIVDGCPPGLVLTEADIQPFLELRRTGTSRHTSQRKEPDQVRILSGVFEGRTTGTPIGLLIENEDQRSRDYEKIKDRFRPGHADYTYQEKYGFRDYRGGGRSSARETLARVAAGALAKTILAKANIKIQAYVSQVGPLKLTTDYKALNIPNAETNIIRCPDDTMAEKMIEFIDETRKNKDTVGGVVSCVIEGSPVGLGEPVFDKLHAELGKAMLSINAVKGFEYGSGFAGTMLRGSEHNDEFVNQDGKIHTKTNHSGGVQGGISNGEDIYFNVAFKPVATIMQDQTSVDKSGNEVTVSGKGRHDPCVVPRAVPIVEAMAALVLADFVLRNKASKI